MFSCTPHIKYNKHTFSPKLFIINICASPQPPTSGLNLPLQMSFTLRSSEILSVSLWILSVNPHIPSPQQLSPLLLIFCFTKKYPDHNSMHHYNRSSEGEFTFARSNFSGPDLKASPCRITFRTRFRVVTESSVNESSAGFNKTNEMRIWSAEWTNCVVSRIFWQCTQREWVCKTFLAVTLHLLPHVRSFLKELANKIGAKIIFLCRVAMGSQQEYYYK